MKMNFHLYMARRDMKRHGCVWIGLLILVLVWGNVTPIAAEDNPEKLDERYQQWLDLVHYIITPMERKVFLSLKSDKERDALIELFWKQRDPTRGTPENEFREEHLRRFAHANKYFRFGAPVPGWKTDRGRIYILLGPPVSEEEVITNGFHPVLIWDYFGNAENGLPTGFRVVFYKRSGMGQYRLYLPTADGPQALLTTQSHTIDPMNYEALYKAIKEYSATVAEASLSLIPGEQRSGYSPSLQAPMLISRIYDLPKSRINATYARNFLNYKGIVDVDVVTNYVNSRNQLTLLRDPVLNTHFLHFSLLPELLSVDFSDERDQFYFNYELTVVLRSADDPDRELFKYSKNFPVYANEEDLNNRLSKGIVVSDYFPVAPGEFIFSAVLQNSVNREISYFDRKVTVPAPTGGAPRLYGPLLSYRIQPVGDPGFAAYQVVDRQVSIDPDSSFGMKESIYLFFSVYRDRAETAFRTRIEVRNEQEFRPYARTYMVDVPAGKETWVHDMEIENPGNGAYRVRVILLGAANEVLDSREVRLSIAPREQVFHPPVASKRLPSNRVFLFDMMLAAQYANTGRPGPAADHYEAALARQPEFPPLIKSYAEFLLAQRNPRRLLEIIAPLENDRKYLFDYHALRGKALHVQGNNTLAVQALLEANKVYDSDTSVLNALGAALANTGEKVEARKALEASLRLNPDQVDVRKMLQSLEKGRKP